MVLLLPGRLMLLALETLAPLVPKKNPQAIVDTFPVSIQDSGNAGTVISRQQVCEAVRDQTPRDGRKPLRADLLLD